MRRAATISAGAHLRAMRYCAQRFRDGATAVAEYEIEAELLHKVATREFDVKLKTISWSHEEETETDESGY
jgi:Xaa-Pro aminopeptidase